MFLWMEVDNNCCEPMENTDRFCHAAPLPPYQQYQMESVSHTASAALAPRFLYSTSGYD